MRSMFAPVAACACLAALPSYALGETALNERVMVVYNAAQKDSHAVAKYYMDRRGIPQANLCKIDTDEDVIQDGSRYEPEVKKPLRACLEKIGKQQILYIVMSYRTPYSVEMGGHTRAVDQLIADIWDEYAGPRGFGRDSGDQPYFGKAQSQGNAYEPFVSLAKYRDESLGKTIYSVWRLDAATPELAKGLVDKALYAEAHGLKGKGYFDIRGPIQSYSDNGYGAGEWDIYRASQLAKKAGFEVTLDEKPTEFGTAPSLLRCENAALYAGWYSLQHYNDVFTWAPGAIGFHSDSASATSPRRGDNWAGGALMRGITVTSGSVTEPFLEGLVHPDQIFLYLFQGGNVGDAVLRGTRWLKWMILNFGDPLYKPFPEGGGPFGSTIYHETWFGIIPDSVVGSGVAMGKFALSDKVDKPTAISFKSTNPELVSLPPNATIPPGANGAEFRILVKPIAEQTSVTVTLTAGTETISNTLNLYPLLMGLTLSQAEVKNDGAATGTVTLFVPAPSQGITVKLSSNQAEAIVPAELKIPAGARNGTFTLSAKGAKTEVTATITAAVDGVAKTAPFKVTP